MKFTAATCFTCLALVTLGLYAVAAIYPEVVRYHAPGGCTADVGFLRYRIHPGVNVTDSSIRWVWCMDCASLPADEASDCTTYLRAAIGFAVMMAVAAVGVLVGAAVALWCPKPSLVPLVVSSVAAAGALVTLLVVYNRIRVPPPRAAPILRAEHAVDQGPPSLHFHVVFFLYVIAIALNVLLALHVLAVNARMAYTRLK